MQGLEVYDVGGGGGGGEGHSGISKLLPRGVYDTQWLVTFGSHYIGLV